MAGGSPAFQARIRCGGGSNLAPLVSEQATLEIDVKRGKVHHLEVLDEVELRCDRSKDTASDPVPRT